MPPTREELERSYLGHPFWGELPEEVRRVRRNLMVFGCIAVVMQLGSVTVDPEQPIFGFKLLGLNDALLRFGLALVIAYQLVNMVWYAANTLAEWRLRVTGTRKAAIERDSMLTFTEEDGPRDARQSTLYYWWGVQANQIGNVAGLARRLEAFEAEANAKVAAAIGPDPQGQNLNNVLKALTEFRQQVAELNRSIKSVPLALDSMRIPASLALFDSWFRGFQESANLQWLVMQVLVPIALGSVGVALLLMY